MLNVRARNYARHTYRRTQSGAEVFRPFFSKYFITVNSLGPDSPARRQALEEACVFAFSRHMPYMCRKVVKGEEKGVDRAGEKRLAMVSLDEILHAEGRPPIELRGNMEVGSRMHQLHYHFTVEIIHRIHELGNARTKAQEVRAQPGQPLGVRLFGNFLKHILVNKLRHPVNVDVKFITSQKPLEVYIGKDARKRNEMAALNEAMEALGVEDKDAVLRKEDGDD